MITYENTFKNWINGISYALKHIIDLIIYDIYVRNLLSFSNWKLLILCQELYKVYVE